MGITREERCAYTSSSFLSDILFHTDPPVRVASGTTGTLELGGRAYRAWVSTLDEESWVTVYPAD